MEGYVSDCNIATKFVKIKFGVHFWIVFEVQIYKHFKIQIIIFPFHFLFRMVLQPEVSKGYLNNLASILLATIDQEVFLAKNHHGHWPSTLLQRSLFLCSSSCQYWLL